MRAEALHDRQEDAMPQHLRVVTRRLGGRGTTGAASADFPFPYLTAMLPPGMQ